MARKIPLTHFGEYLAHAKAIQRNLGAQADPAAVRQTVADLADLAVRALDEMLQTFEGLALLVMAMHPDVTRSPARPNRRTPPVRPQSPRPRHE